MDIHAHVLPGIDDGPPDLESALAMARAAANAGTTAIAATPHLRPDFPDVHLDELGWRCRDLRAALEREQIPIQLVGGAEASLGWALEASAEQLALASFGQKGHDLLVEAPFSPVIGLDRLLDDLQAKGYRVTLAHPERSAEFHRDEPSLRRLVDQGVLLQINSDSLVGSSGSPIQRFARHLCTESLAHALASDGHRAAEWRPVTTLAEGVAAAAELVGAERAQWLAEGSPRAIVNATELPAPPAIAGASKRWRLFGRR